MAFNKWMITLLYFVDVILYLSVCNVIYFILICWWIDTLCVTTIEHQSRIVRVREPLFYYAHGVLLFTVLYKLVWFALLFRSSIFVLPIVTWRLTIPRRQWVVWHDDRSCLPCEQLRSFLWLQTRWKQLESMLRSLCRRAFLPATGQERLKSSELVRHFWSVFCILCLSCCSDLLIGWLTGWLVA